MRHEWSILNGFDKKSGTPTNLGWSGRPLGERTGVLRLYIAVNLEKERITQNPSRRQATRPFSPNKF
jgi:hypothetical protein